MPKDDATQESSESARLEDASRATVFFRDLVERGDLTVANRRSVEALVGKSLLKLGAFSAWDCSKLEDLLLSVPEVTELYADSDGLAAAHARAREAKVSASDPRALSPRPPTPQPFGRTIRFIPVEQSLDLDGPASEASDETLEARVFARPGAPGLSAEDPFASWLLARLCFLSGGVLPIGGHGVADGGGWGFDLDVCSPAGERLAVLGIQGDMQGAAVFARAASGTDPRALMEELVTCLVETHDLAACRVSVYDPEWKEDPDSYAPRPTRGSRAVYGWDGKKLLGRRNPRER